VTDGLSPRSRWLLRNARLLQVAAMAVVPLAVLGAVLRTARPSVLVFAAVVAGLLMVLLRSWARWQRERLVREAPLPQFLKRKLRDAHPGLSQKDTELVERGLRQFFLACLRSRRAFVAMPSRVVDGMWHEFILHTQAYGDWCSLVLGRFLHHTPAEALGPHASRNDGLRRSWYWACRDESIDPRRPSRLPLLFALDRKLGIAGGYVYSPDCRGERAVGGNTHCGSDFADGSAASGDADGMGGSDPGGSDGDGDGGSGGDGGCGGGGD
jgi:hypothetical protein